MVGLLDSWSVISLNGGMSACSPARIAGLDMKASPLLLLCHVNGGLVWGGHSSGLLVPVGDLGNCILSLFHSQNMFSTLEKDSEGRMFAILPP